MVLLNEARDTIAGIGVGAFGWDDTVLRVTDMTVAENVFSPAYISIPSAPSFNLGGLPNVMHPNVNPANIPNAIASQDISLIKEVSLTPTTGTGNLDIGIDGGLIRDGDAHARVFFEVIGVGDTMISVGTNRERGDSVVSCGQNPDCSGGAFDDYTNLAQLKISAEGPSSAVPEPTAALLFAAGFAVASASAHRARR